MSFVYFIQSPHTHLVKIGFSADVEARMGALRAEGHADIVLLGACRGGRNEEREYHRQFQKLRVMGEWFSPNAELLAEAAKHKCEVSELPVFHRGRKAEKIYVKIETKIDAVIRQLSTRGGRTYESQINWMLDQFIKRGMAKVRGDMPFETDEKLLRAVAQQCAPWWDVNQIAEYELKCEERRRVSDEIEFHDHILETRDVAA